MDFRSPALSTLLAALGLLLLGAVVVAWRLLADADRPPGFAWNRPALSEAEFAALGARPGWRCAAVPAQGGLSLRGLLRPPRAAAAPWLLFFQGNSLRLLAEGQEFLEAVAGAEDLGLAVVSWQGYDGSPGRPGRDALVADALAATRWLQANGARGSPLHLVSFSLGTLPALAVAVEGQEGPALQRPRSLTLLAPYTALRMHGDGWLERRFGADLFDARPLLPRVQVPTLVIHGRADQALPLAMGQAVGQAIRGARLLVLDGVGHLDLLADPRTHAAVRAAVLGAR
jgi:hypothetical protein